VTNTVQSLVLLYPLHYGDSDAVCSDMLAIFDCGHQDKLAHAVYTMTKFRDQCLLSPQGAAISVGALQSVVEEDVELVRRGSVECL
jgi:hypothetical protein